MKSGFLQLDFLTQDLTPLLWVRRGTTHRNFVNNFNQEDSISSLLASLWTASRHRTLLPRTINGPLHHRRE